MPPNIKVCINGFVLSTLLFDCANDRTDKVCKEGFLYGTITRNVRDEINDVSLTGTQEDIVISISSSIPIGKILSFYDDRGEVNKEELEFNLQDRRKKIIGWYRFRRYSPLYPTARETIVHRNLRAFFDNDMDVGSQYFILAVFSASNLANFATHSYDYAFFTQRHNSTFKSISTTILNLGDTRNTYRSGSMALPFLDSSSFRSVLENCWNMGNLYNVEDEIQIFHRNLRSKLESLQEELAASDAVNASLEEDIENLNNELQSLLATQEQLSSASHSTTTSHSAAAVSETVPSDSTSRAETVPSDSTPRVEPQDSGDNASPDDRHAIVDPILPHESKDISFGLKRAAVDPTLPEESNKRMCLDKYFGSEEQRIEGSDIHEDNTSKISSTSKDKSSDSRLMTVDPDSREASSASQNKVECVVESQIATVVIKDVNMIPSPSSTVEVVISDTGSQTCTDPGDSALMEFCVICLSSLIINGLLNTVEYKLVDSFISDFRSCSSAESPEVKEPSPDPALSPKGADASNVVTESNITTGVELQSETVSSVRDVADTSVSSDSTEESIPQNLEEKED